MNKAELRSRMIARRQALEPAEAEGLALGAQSAVVGSAAFAAARTVLLYAAFRGEVATDAIARAAVAAGKGLVLPRVIREPRGLAFHRFGGDFLGMPAGAYGIREPAADWPLVGPGEIDLAVVPGVAFDLAGNRLGYGGGYYDRTLPVLRQANPQVVLLGLAYRFQVVAALPRDPHDIPLDGVATEDGLL